MVKIYKISEWSESVKDECRRECKRNNQRAKKWMIQRLWFSIWKGFNELRWLGIKYCEKFVIKHSRVSKFVDKKRKNRNKIEKNWGIKSYLKGGENRIMFLKNRTKLSFGGMFLQKQWCLWRINITINILN